MCIHKGYILIWRPAYICVKAAANASAVLRVINPHLLLHRYMLRFLLVSLVAQVCVCVVVLKHVWCVLLRTPPPHHTQIAQLFCICKLPGRPSDQG